MKRLIVLLYIAPFCLGQTAGRNPDAATMTNRVDRLSRRFPPEVIAPAASPPKPFSGRFCAHPSADGKSLSVKPCGTPAYRLRLLPPPDKKGEPATRP
jgi:hypothetical protein